MVIATNTAYPVIGINLTDYRSEYMERHSEGVTLNVHTIIRNKIA